MTPSVGYGDLPMTTRDPEVFVWAFMAFGILLLIVGLAVRRLKQKAGEAPRDVPSLRLADPPTTLRPEPDISLPLCDCGAPADRPAAEIIPRASWWDAVRRALGMAPRYTIRVPTGESEAVPVYCQVHGRVADTFVDEELAVAVVVERKAAESKIVQRMAAFITGGLKARVLESLTVEQRSALKKRGQPAKTADVISIARAANGD